MRKLNVDRMRNTVLKGVPDKVVIFLDPLDNPDAAQHEYDMQLAFFERAALAKYGPHHTIRGGR